MEQELKQYDEVSRENEPNEDKHTTNIIVFLNGTKYIMYDAEFRTEISRATNYLLQKYTSGPIHDLLQTLNAKIRAIQQDVTDHIPKNIKKIGKGGYGCVIQPALPNRSENAWLQHNNNVSKLYFDKNYGEKAIRNADSLYSDLKNNGHKMFKQMTYKGSNFPANVQSNCELSPNKEVLSLRAPYLGIPINQMIRYYRKFQNISFGTILEQMLKLFSQLNTIQEKGYVHGDIREGNVMANPDNGVMTLIDFDWYMPKDKFFKDYFNNLGFYSNPPESLISENIQKFIRNAHIPLKADESPSELQDYVQGSNSFTFRIRLNNDVSRHSVHKANVENIKQFANITHIGQYYDAMFPTFDSYGLGFTLLEFCSFVYPPRQPLTYLTDKGKKYSDEEIAIIETTIQKLYNDILLPMIDLTMQTRISAREAYLRMSHVCEDFKTEMRATVSNNLERMARRTEMLESYKPQGKAVKTTKTRKHRKN